MARRTDRATARALRPPSPRTCSPQCGQQSLCHDVKISVRAYTLAEALQPFFTGLYATTIKCPPGKYVVDCLHPEWAALRFTIGPPPIARIGSGDMVKRSAFVANGPTSQAINFGVTTSQIWGLRLQPVGWAKFVDLPANQLSDRLVNGASHPAFALFAPLLDVIRSAKGDEDRVAARVNDFLLGHIKRPVRKMQMILNCQEGLIDPRIDSVAELSDRLEVSARNLERLCGRYFGFPPKLLLRRQRFLRSLARFMAEPQMCWGDALDSQYYDQAQFVYDFRQFMGMTPRDYAKAEHPLLGIVIADRLADQGVSVRVD